MRRGLRFALLLLIVLGAGGGALAQSAVSQSDGAQATGVDGLLGSGFGQYSTYGQTSGAGQNSASGSYGAGAQGSSAPDASAYYGAGGAAGSAGAYGVNPGGAGAYSPTVLFSGAGQGAGAPSNLQVLSPTELGATPRPLYARPTTTPGQFELYTRPPPLPGEFEVYVAKALGAPLPRFGAALILNGGRNFANPAPTTVPPGYRLNPGDELLIGVTGSVEASLRVVLDGEGRVLIPRIGAVGLAGVRYGDLQSVLSSRFAEQYKQAHVSATLVRLHGLSVYVTGFAVSPGAYTVSSLSTLVDAVLAAGGPASGGSFRSIQLRRNGALVVDFDLYDLLLKGDKSHDAVLENGDVINIQPVGPETAISGSVNAPAIYEAKPRETLTDLIGYAGGFNSVADDKRLIVVRLGDLDREGSQQLTLEQARSAPVERGDIVRVLALTNVARPRERQAILATIEGEVNRPGRYYLPPGSSLKDLLDRAGGLSEGAFVFGSEFDRVSIKRQQKVSFEKAISDLQLSAAVAPLSALGRGSDSAANAPVRQQATNDVLQRLREREPDGRLILALNPDSTNLPGDLAIEDNDRLYVPPVPRTVGVFGAVFQPGAFVFQPSRKLRDYLAKAGGPRRFADRGEIFVVRANGSVASTRLTGGFADRPALPGDVIFVPVKTSPGSWERIKDIASLVYQFSIGVATLAILARQ